MIEMSGPGLKLKYRCYKPKNQHRRSNYNGNSGHSTIHKHWAHPDIHGIRRDS